MEITIDRGISKSKWDADHNSVVGAEGTVAAHVSIAILPLHN
jgi:hypothetical protein